MQLPTIRSRREGHEERWGMTSRCGCCRGARPGSFSTVPFAHSKSGLEESPWLLVVCDGCEVKGCEESVRWSKQCAGLVKSFFLRDTVGTTASSGRKTPTIMPLHFVRRRQGKNMRMLQSG